MSSTSPDMDRSEDQSSNFALHTDYEAEDKKYDPNTETPESSSVDDATFTADSSYTVNCTVSIALAILKENEEYLTEKRKKGTKTESSSELVESPGAEGYYCIEYNMLPDDPEPLRVDLVMFKLAAKLYMASETKVVKPWREGNKVWVSWSQTLKLNVTRELLIKMASHKITVRVWDSKDKVSLKARNDRPKAFRLPQDKPGEDPDQMCGIKKMVCKMRAINEKENLKIRKSMNKCDDPESVPIKSDLKDGSQMVPTKKTLLPDFAEQTEVKQGKESASLELSFTPLLAGSTLLTDSLELCSGGVKEGFWAVTLDQQLISEELKVELNPLVIRVLSACSLPSTPTQSKCLPVYCQYKFHDMPIHRTKGYDHSTNIYFRDVNVIFTGLISHGKLFEFLRGPPVEIEVHDRDRKNEKPSVKPAVFGTDPNDARLATVDLWTNALKADTEPLDPYGIAKLDLSDLLQGCRHLKLTLPISCSSSEQNENPSDTAMPVGNFIETGAQLKVQVQLAYPLHPKDEKVHEDCPLGRIIFVFRYNNTPILAKLTSEILQINANAFQLNHYPEETIQRVLSGQKICTKEAEKTGLNVLTGFHLMDKALHLFVLEGLKDQAVKRLWTTVHMKLDGDEEEQVTVLYNSDLSFSERLYDLLDLSLSPFCFLKPLETIMKDPLVFIRNAVPHACLEAMKRISYIRRAKTLQEAVHYNLFPSAGMVLSLNKQFGLDVGRENLCLPAKTQESWDIPETIQHHMRKRTYTPIDNFNREYFQWKRSGGKNVKDFIQANIEDAHKASNDLQKPKPYTFLDDVTEGQTINYDNSETKCGKQLYRTLSKDMCFSYPGFKSSIESNQHPKLPDDARIDELRKPWKENILHSNKLRPTLSRSRLPWIQRYQDFELYTRPPSQFGTKLPLSIHLAGETLREEQLQAANVQYDRWMRRILLDETSTESGRVSEFRCHMKGTSLDKLQDILKDKPMKYSLKRPGMALKPIPVISVVQHFETTGSAEKEANIPFAPGPFQNHSLSWDKNIIPRYSSQYSKFHFRDYWRPHSFLHKRSVLPFIDDEKRLHFFQKPAEVPQTPVITAHLVHSRNRNIKETRTNKNITLHVH